MKKMMTVWPLVAFVGGAWAQTGLTLSGTVDVGVQQMRAAGVNRSSVMSGGNATSKLVIRGTEDLGQGLQAFLWLEAGLSADTGSFGTANTRNQPHLNSNSGGGMTFDRRSIVGLKSAYGAVQMGRDWTPTYETFTGKYDPFGLGIGIGINYQGSKNADGVRASNSIAYASPSFWGGLSVKLQHWMGEGPTDSLGKGSGFRINYDRGAVGLAASMTSTHLAGASVVYRNLAAQYKLSDATTLSMSWTHDQYGLRKWDGWLFGVRQKMGAGELKVSLSQVKTNEVGSPKGQKLALGYVHNLSKRTAVYGTLAHIKNSNGGSYTTASFATQANRSVSGLELGVRHNF